jgi:hypothetical protein
MENCSADAFPGAGGPDLFYGTKVAARTGRGF